MFFSRYTANFVSFNLLVNYSFMASYFCVIITLSMNFQSKDDDRILLFVDVCQMTFMVSIGGNKMLPLQIMLLELCPSHLLHQQLHHGLHSLHHMLLPHHRLSLTAVEALVPIIQDLKLLFHLLCHQAMLQASLRAHLHTRN